MAQENEFFMVFFGIPRLAGWSPGDVQAGVQAQGKLSDVGLAVHEACGNTRQRQALNLPSYRKIALGIDRYGG